MHNSWGNNENGRRALLRNYLGHLQAIFSSANAGEIIAGAILYLKQISDPEDAKKFVRYDVEVESYECLSGEKWGLGSWLETQVDSIPFKLRKNRTKYMVADVITKYLHVFDETPTGAYCLYLEGKYPELEKIELQQTKKRWTEAATYITFGDSIVRNVLKKSVPPLRSEHSGSLQYFQSQKRLAAGREFVADLLEIVSDEDGRGIYENLNLVSARAYESQENKGSMVIIPSNALNGLREKMEIAFVSPVEMTGHKGVRKLFEIASGGRLYLVCDGMEVHGLISKSRLSEKYTGKYLLIQMNGHLNWEIQEPEKENNEKLVSRIAFDGTNFILKDDDNNQKRKDEIASRLSKIPECYEKDGSTCKRCGYHENCKLLEKPNLKKCQDNMNRVIEYAVKQRHGTTVVFSRYAKEEADRLQNTSFRIKKKELTDPDIVKQITAIDGAVLCDFDGNCHAIGVILDGQTIAKKPEGEELVKSGSDKSESDETIERGARFNSAIRYKNAYPCSVICIVSEDGYVNVV